MLDEFIKHFFIPRYMNQKYSGFKKGMLCIGIVLLVVGVFLLIYGFLMLSGGFGFDDGSIGEMASRGFSSIIFIAGGGFMLAIGFILVYFSQIGRVAKYFATETHPAVKTVGHAVGSGVTEGISDAGGLKVNSSEQIKIKCHHCGYLESIDAEFCSKCGKKI
jgi:hypothetical protein